MEVTVIHAGLECGAISQVYPDMDKDFYRTQHV